MSELPARFWERVEKTEGCWLWTAALTANGYGKTYLDKRQVYAHRVAYAALVGPIPEGAQIDHRCHVRRCVRPDHLQAVDQVANQQNRSGAQSNSRSGVRGVHWVANVRKWRVQVKTGRRVHSGGMFADLAEAEAVATAMRRRLMANSLSDRGYTVHS